MDNGELYELRFLRPPRLATLRVAQLHVQEDLQGELQVSQGKPAVHFTVHLRWTVLWKLS